MASQPNAERPRFVGQTNRGLFLASKTLHSQQGLAHATNTALTRPKGQGFILTAADFSDKCACLPFKGGTYNS